MSAEPAGCVRGGDPITRAVPAVWFSDAPRPEQQLLFCLVCWAYGDVIVRHRPRPAEPLVADDRTGAPAATA